MANAIYPKWKEAVMQAASNSSLAGTVKVALVDTGAYTYSAAHEFYSSLAGVTADSAALASKTYASGTFDAASATFTAVSGAVSEALVIYIDTTVAGTSRLVAYIDTGVTGLPVTPNGGNITVAWDAAGIFTL